MNTELPRSASSPLGFVKNANCDQTKINRLSIAFMTVFVVAFMCSMYFTSYGDPTFYDSIGWVAIMAISGLASVTCANCKIE